MRRPDRSERSDMLVKRHSSELTIDLDRERDAKGLYAFLTGNPASVSPEDFKLGERIYKWFFGSVEALSLNYVQETETKYIKNLER